MVTISSPEISNIENELNNSKNKLIDSIQIAFNEIMDLFIKFDNNFKVIIKLIEEFDLLQNKCYIASKFNYNKPLISNFSESFMKVKGLRHALIEHINIKELYVPNDIIFDSREEIKGILLYGTNAVGKTSFIKAIGIMIIMAQAGLYVPCQELEYFPYKKYFYKNFR